MHCWACLADQCTQAADSQAALAIIILWSRHHAGRDDLQAQNAGQEPERLGVAPAMHQVVLEAAANTSALLTGAAVLEAAS
jgi:hypothetical protein